MLDFTASAAQLGKPGGGADLKLGLATAPALYAWEEFPELGSMIERKFSGEDDVERVSFAAIGPRRLRRPRFGAAADFDPIPHFHRCAPVWNPCSLYIQARHLIARSSGAERTLELARKHSDLARKALEGLPESEARTALDEMARDTLTRKK